MSAERYKIAGVEISRGDLDQAVSAGVITAAQAEALWTRLAGRPGPDPTGASTEAVQARFDFAHVAYYFGALIVIGAMGWFMSLGWESFGGGGILAIASGYALAFLVVGRTFWRREQLRVPGGLLIAMAVGMTPLATYGLERLLGVWPVGDPGVYRGFHEWVKGGWFAMEIATVIAGAIAIHFFRFPFLSALVAFTFWYMSMDLAPLLFHGAPTASQRSWVSVAVGAGMLLAAFLIDRRTREDFAFWLYLFGLLAFWGGLSSMEPTSEARAAIYLVVNVGLVLASVALQRRVFLVFGAFGVFGYLAHLSYHVFEHSVMFPFVLSAIGLSIIALGVHVRRHHARYEDMILNLVPAAVREHLPPARQTPLL
jgi:hypothetical protein